MATLGHQAITCEGTTLSYTAAAEAGDATRIAPNLYLEVVNASAGDRTVTIEGDYRAMTHTIVFDNGTLPAAWEQGYDTASNKWDEIEVVDGYITIPNPDDGPRGNVEEYDPLNPNSGARAAMFFDFGADYADDVEVTITWTGRRPAEATPLLHVDLTTTEGGIGVWPVADVFPGTPGFQPVAMLGNVGTNPDEFEVLETESLAAYPDDVPAEITVRSTGGEVTCYFNGTQVCDAVTLPAALVGATKHGIALDHNQLDDNEGYGGERDPNWPTCRAHMTIAKVAGGDISVTVPAGKSRLIGPLDTPRVSAPAGLVSWTYDDHTSVTVAAVVIDPKGGWVTP